MITRLTKSFVDKAATPENRDQVFYRDDQLRGFALRVTAGGVKSFVIETVIENRVRRLTLGKYGRLTVDEARKLAKIKLGDITKGKNPITAKKVKQIRGVTLKMAFEQYIITRKSLKASTILDYRRVLQQIVSDWLDKPLKSISEDMIIKRHMDYGNSNSPARANLVMRLLRAIFYFAMDFYKIKDTVPIFKYNPVKVLSTMDAWYDVKPKKTIIKQSQLTDWYQGIKALKEVMPYERAEMWQDFFLLILFTGLRRQEASKMRWADVDLNGKTFTVHDTKNGDSHTLPMSDYLYELFLRRKGHLATQYVFPCDSESGHIVEPKTAMSRVVELSGIKFTLHDLRRTFITTAERLDIPAYSLKRLLNHRMKNDITSGYIITDPERLRRPMQIITTSLIKLLEGELSNENVVDINSAKLNSVFR